MKLSLKTAISAISLCCVGGVSANQITITENAQYYDEKIIQTNILDECKELGSQFSASTEKYLSKNSWEVTRSNELPESGLSIELEITNALSGGNAFMGHQKSVTIEATLMKDGQEVNTFRGTRNSNGGFGAGFKSSCDILNRCVNTLGKDISKWLKKQDI